MKKLLLCIVTLALSLSLSACGSKKEQLFILNWGEFMDMDVISDFEKEFNCKVIYEEVASNEEMYTKLISGTTHYDLMFPSEYMVDKMIEEKLLQPINKEIFTNSNKYFPKVMEMLERIDPGNLYAVPYTWGTLGILYNKEFENEVKAEGFGVLFKPVGNIKNVGMYDSSRDSIASALIYLGYNVNTNDLDELKEAEDLLNGFKYKLFLDDALKTNIVSGNLDVALTYSGDYLVQAYSDLEDGLEINYGYYAPDNTNLWVDNLVIPYNAPNATLANEFIQFISETENALRISNFIGDCPVMPHILDLIREDEELKFITYSDFFLPYEEGENRQVYEYQGVSHYQKLDDIYTRIKAKY